MNKDEINLPILKVLCLNKYWYDLNLYCCIDII